MTDHSTCQVRSMPDRAPDVRGPPYAALRGRAPSPRPSVRVSLLDGFALHFEGRELSLNSCKARALIAYLVLTPGMKETRDRLIGLLWSETEDAKARASLRQLLHCLRDTFDREGLQGLYADRVHVGLDDSVFVTDLDQALASVDRGDPTSPLVNDTCITDSFLRGYDYVDPSFRSWLTIKRNSVHQLLIRKLEAQLCETAHFPEATKRIARALFQVDPTHETACQTLMRAYVASGNAGGALAAYKRLWDCLEQEYDIEPSRVTQELVVAIKSGSYQAAAAGSDPRRSNDGAQRAEEVDPVILLALKLAVAWMTASEPGNRGYGLVSPSMCVGS
jgi:DNA-binding SARP family transcriptional activator